MQLLTIILGFLAVTDLILTPVILSNIRKTGGFHYLISTLHKFVLFSFVAAITTLLFRNGNVSIPAMNLHSFLSMILIGVLAFSFVKTFEIDDYFINKFEPSKYKTNDMTEEGKSLMQAVFEDMRSQNEKTFFERFSNMVSNFVTNISQDIDVVLMVLTNNTKTKDAYSELHKILGNDVKFAAMTNKDLFFLVKTRVVMDGLALAAAAIVFVV